MLMKSSQSLMPRSEPTRGQDVTRRSDIPAILRLFRTWCQKWQQRQDLKNLNDHLLRDIGITKEQARRESARPFWE